MQNGVNQYNIQQPYVQGQQPVPQYCTQPAPQVYYQPQAGAYPVQQPVYQTQPAGYQPTYPQAAQNIPVPNYSGVNIQIFNPSVATPGAPAPVYNVNAPQYPTTCYPSDYYTNTWGQNGANGANNGNNNTNTTTTTTTTNATTEDKKKTEKRDIVLLTDSYIKNLENYLNSQDKKIRLMGAKEVQARLHEDHSRRDDKALTALINKMLQDPYQPVKFTALTALATRDVTGDDYTVKVLENMRNSTTAYGEDAAMANEILLKMSGQIVQKEFEVKEGEKKKDPNKKL